MTILVVVVFVESIERVFILLGTVPAVKSTSFEFTLSPISLTVLTRTLYFLPGVKLVRV